MKTLFLGQLSNNITIDSYLSKHQEHNPYNLFYYTEDGSLRLHSNGNDVPVTYDMDFIFSFCSLTDTPITTGFTTNKGYTSIANGTITFGIVNTSKTLYLYYPIFKAIKSIKAKYGIGEKAIDIKNNITSESTVTINVNQQNLQFRQVTIDITDIDKPNNVTIAFNNISTHFDNFNNPHDVTAMQVGLGNVDNTSDEDKPVSTAVINYVSLAVKKINNLFEVHKSNMTTHLDSANANIQQSISDAIEAITTDNILPAVDMIKSLGDIGSIDSRFKEALKSIEDRLDLKLKSVDAILTKHLNDSGTSLSEYVKQLNNQITTQNTMLAEYRATNDRLTEVYNRNQSELNEIRQMLRSLRKEL